MLLLLYLNSISANLTPIGQQAAMLMNDIAPCFFKYEASNDQHELSLTLLKEVSLLSMLVSGFIIFFSSWVVFCLFDAPIR